MEPEKWIASRIDKYRKLNPVPYFVLLFVAGTSLLIAGFSDSTIVSTIFLLIAFMAAVCVSVIYERIK